MTKSARVQSRVELLAEVDNDVGILKQCVIEKKIDKIPGELFMRPSDNQTWRGYLVPALQLEDILPSFKTILAAHIVGKTSDNKYYEVTMCNCCAQFLQSCAFELHELLSDGVPVFTSAAPSRAAMITFPIVTLMSCFKPVVCQFIDKKPRPGLSSSTAADALRRPLEYDVSQPTEKEIEVYGIHRARSRARERFITNAIHAISSAKHGRGLDQYYLSSLNHKTCHISVAIKWAIFARDVRSSRQDVMRQFFRHYAFITLHAFDDLETACNSDFAQWGQSEWLSILEEFPFTRWKTLSLNSEAQVLSLIQAVFASACNELRPLSGTFDRTYSAEQNLEMLSSLFLCGAELAVPFGGLERMDLERYLPRVSIFDGDEVEIPRLTQEIKTFVPV